MSVLNRIKLLLKVQNLPEKHQATVFSSFQLRLSDSLTAVVTDTSNSKEEMFTVNLINLPTCDSI